MLFTPLLMVGAYILSLLSLSLLLATCARADYYLLGRGCGGDAMSATSTLAQSSPSPHARARSPPPPLTSYSLCVYCVHTHTQARIVALFFFFFQICVSLASLALFIYPLSCILYNQKTKTVRCELVKIIYARRLHDDDNDDVDD